MLVLLTTQALREHPVLNARCTPEGEWERSAGVHFGLAVDTEQGLVVPVVRNAQDLDLPALTRRIRELVRRAREGVLTVEESTGGTFTLTNLGAFGIDTFTPILNPPECGILGVGRIERRPVVVGDSIVVRPMVNLSLTFDHRALDGAPAARFLQTLRGLIETARG
jgi:pyruvate dehydrogenase E2 component (dihydrolipoamide acetyltransferase)